MSNESHQKRGMPRRFAMQSMLAAMGGSLIAPSGTAQGAQAALNPITVQEDDRRIRLETSALSATINKKGYVSGVAAGTFIDKKSGFRDQGYGLDIVDWIMEPGSDVAYRDQLVGDLKYETGNSVHGNIPKRSLEGPQICTQAKELSPKVHPGPGFVAVTMDYQYKIAAPGKNTGSTWEQTLIFPEGKRYFVSMDQITAMNESPAMFLRVDMPGHIKHDQGNTFSEVYLSYQGRIPAQEFTRDFAPDEKFLYQRDDAKIPDRVIRAYHLRDPLTGADGPWLAGMTLDPSAAYEGWCHQRGYVCMIEEIGGRPVKKGESFGAAFIVGFFDFIDEMHAVYDQYKGARRVTFNDGGWSLSS